MPARSRCLERVPCWWDGGQIAQTLDAVLSKGQAMPEKNRFPAILTQTRTGGFFDPIPFDPTQITSPTNRSRAEPRTPSPTLSKLGRAPHLAGIGGHPLPAVAFSDLYNGAITGDVAATMGTPGSSVNAGGPTLLVPKLGVRRLTPTECERLQGFPDGHTLISHRGKPAADGPRYKAIGNSMAVPVVRWIGERINYLTQLPPRT